MINRLKFSGFNVKNQLQRLKLSETQSKIDHSVHPIHGIFILVNIYPIDDQKSCTFFKPSFGK